MEKLTYMLLAATVELFAMIYFTREREKYGGVTATICICCFLVTAVIFIAESTEYLIYILKM